MPSSTEPGGVIEPMIVDNRTLLGERPSLGWTLRTINAQTPAYNRAKEHLYVRNYRRRVG